MRVLVFDTEATGLPKTKIINPDTLHLWPHIVQFSYLIYDTELNDVVVVEDNIVKVGAGINIPAESTAIHGITNGMSQTDGVGLSQVLQDFFRDLKTVDRLVGHNISFDVNLVIVELLRMIYDAAPNGCDNDVSTNKNNLHQIANYKNTYCTLLESIDLCAIKAVTKLGKEYNKFPKLIELHQKLFRTIPNNLHNSLTDILVTLRCYVMMTGNVDLNEMCNKYKQLIRARNAL
jgi:DNA polymerase III epsilon subunit-like protein